MEKFAEKDERKNVDIYGIEEEPNEVLLRTKLRGL